MSTMPDPLDPDAHSQEAMEDAEEKMLLRHDVDEATSSEEGPSPLGEGHDPDAMAEATEKMLLREKRT